MSRRSVDPIVCQRIARIGTHRQGKAVYCILAGNPRVALLATDTIYVQTATINTNKTINHGKSGRGRTIEDICTW